MSFSEDPKKPKATKGPGEKWKVGPNYEVKQLIGTAFVKLFLKDF